MHLSMLSKLEDVVYGDEYSRLRGEATNRHAGHLVHVASCW